MSLVFQNIDPPHPPLCPASVQCTPRLCCGGRTHSPGGEGDGGSIFWKTRDIGLPSYSIISLRTQPSLRGSTAVGIVRSDLGTALLVCHLVDFTTLYFILCTPCTTAWSLSQPPYPFILRRPRFVFACSTIPASVHTKQKDSTNSYVFAVRKPLNSLQVYVT